MYSDQLLDHFQNPRNIGEFPDADATVEVENPACGDRLRLSVKGSAGRIVRIQFKAKGCVASIACASVLTELVTGKSLDAAARLRQEDIVAAVGGLPPASNHAAALALDAFSLALRRLER